jgi:hypothetical protein
MTIKDCIDIVDNIKPNQYTIKDKVMWLSFIEEIIINEVLKTHEGYDGRYDNFEGYSEDKLSIPLIVQSPYDRLYTAYLKMKIDDENGETTRYNNSAALFNTYMLEYRKYYNKTHMPLNTIGKRDVNPAPKQTVGLSDAEFENLKRELTYILTEYYSKTLSEDKIYDIAMKYIKNNAAMLKGDKGDTPKVGVDYWTDEDKAKIIEYINEQTEVLKSDVEGIQESLLNEAHFRGYLSTNEKIKQLKATPNDFAYSAESNTKWVYDSNNGWINTGISVPDQLTPASDTTPLINGEASVGKENAYARGDHRHPTDTTRASVVELNKVKAETKAYIEEVILGGAW